MPYTITTNLIPGLPKIPYDKGYPVGVAAHATAVYNDTVESERNQTVMNWKKAFAHIFVGNGTILQIADTNYIAYGAGKTANRKGYIHVELCQTYDSERFKRDYSMYVWVIAKLLRDAKLQVIDGVTLMSHKQISYKWKETDHVDPIEYLQSHGVTWDMFVQDVTKEYKGSDDVLKIAILKHTPADEWAAQEVDAKLGGVANFTRQGINFTIPNDAKTAEKLIVIGGPTTKHPNEILLSGEDKFETAKAVGEWLKTQK